jgi:hypothetical protein
VSFVGLGYPVRYWFSVFSRSSGLVDSRDAGQDAQEDAPLRRHVPRLGRFDRSGGSRATRRLLLLPNQQRLPVL